MTTQRIALVGAGLAGCECALQLARRGFAVTLFEQKPEAYSPAHSMPQLAELVCSNSLRSDELASGVGLIKQELRELGSALMAVADATRVPAGKALAVDRELFAGKVTELVEAEPNITLVRKAIADLDDPALEGFERVVISAGPLASESLSASIARAVGAEHLYFYDAIAPIVAADSIDMGIAFWGSRYGEPGEGDYLNCPMNEDEYKAFYQGLLDGEKVASREFEQEKHFEGCMPVEALAARGEKTLAFGPLKPVGFTDPRTGRRPFALLQLRPENGNKTMFNLVGCQTKLTYPAQAVCFRKVPGLEHAEFVRFGSMHRNTYVNAPVSLNEELALKSRPNVHLAGQITGVEGYVESIACGLWVGQMLAAKLAGRSLPKPPATTALGALLNHLSTPAKHFQPSNVHFGLMPEPELIKKSTEDGVGKKKPAVQKGRFKIAKSDDDKMLAFGWANVSITADGELIEDYQEDIIEPEELESAAYKFAELYREGGEMHERGGAAVLIESVVFTEEKMKAMGIPEGTLPVGWWIGFKVLDEDVWEKVKSGEYPMFSIEGEAERVEVEEE